MTQNFNTRHWIVGYCKWINRWIQQEEKKGCTIILYCYCTSCNQINKKSLKIEKLVLLGHESWKSTWSAATTSLYVYVCALHSSAQLVGYCAANEWAFIGSQLPSNTSSAIITFYTSIYRHLQWPHKKAANKSQRWFIQNIVPQTRRAWKGRGSYTTIRQTQKEDCAMVKRNGGEIE